MEDGRASRTEILQHNAELSCLAAEPCEASARPLPAQPISNGRDDSQVCSSDHVMRTSSNRAGKLASRK